MSNKKPEFRSRYSPRVRDSIAINPAEKRTKDSFKDETDINKIVARAQRNGAQLPPAPQPIYGDFTKRLNYEEAFNTVKAARDSFNALPAAIRAECGNNAAIFLEKVQDRTWAEKHGLVEPQASQTPSPAAPDPAAGQAAPANPSEKK